MTFSTDEEAEECIRAKSQGHTVCGKSVEVKRAIPRDADPDQREKNTKMFVGGLSLNSTEDSIRQFFESTFSCQVERVDLIYQKKDQLEPGQEPRPRYTYSNYLILLNLFNFPDCLNSKIFLK